MSNKSYIIEGCKLSSGTHPRLEISALQQDEEQFSLFIQALNNIMDHDYKFEGSDAVNWQQLAGIHGMPYQQWNGDHIEVATADVKPLTGYCHHRDPLFPTWHRVVLLLVEQAVWKEANVIVSQNTSLIGDDGKKWENAADSLRFWDWTKPVAPGAESYFPTVFKKEKVSILEFGGGTKSTKNPLYCYTLSDAIHQGFDEDASSFFKDWRRTYRWPEVKKENPKERYESLDNAFIKGGPEDRQNNVQWLRDKVAGLFTFRTDLDKKWGGNVWDHFSNIRYNTPSQSPLPYEGALAAIEEPHDTVHLNIGSNGHMGDNDVAGFDPIFYLHHCNIDRIYAFWEYVYPAYWIGEGWYDEKTGGIQKFKNTLGTFTQQAGGLIDQSSALTPFRKSETQYWTSNDVHGLVEGSGTPKYYTYPAIKYKITKVQVDLSFDPAKQAEYVSALQKYWSPDLDFSERTLPVLHAPVFYTSPGESGSRFSTLLRSIPHRYETYEKYKLFVIVVTISEHAFNGSFHVELRDRSIPNAVINKVSFLRRSSTANCAACVQREASGSLVRSTMILDSSSIKTLLSDKGLNREDASNDKIIELFENSFEARVVAPDGTVLAESRPGLAREPSCKRLEKGVPHLAFYSASAAHPKGNPGGDVKFFDWIHHTSLLQDDWVDRRG